MARISLEKSPPALLFFHKKISQIRQIVFENDRSEVDLIFFQKNGKTDCVNKAPQPQQTMDKIFKVAQTSLWRPEGLFAKIFFVRTYCALLYKPKCCCRQACFFTFVVLKCCFCLKKSKTLGFGGSAQQKQSFSKKF